jgi:predicted small secreted protein
MLRRIIAAVLILGFAGVLGACNTIEGIGKDITAAGRALNKAAQ